MGSKPHLYKNYGVFEIPYKGETSLTIETQNLLFGGNLSYSGKGLHLDTQNLGILVGSVEVPDGLLRVTA